MAFLSEPGNPASTSFASLAFADDYLSSRLSPAEWTDAEESEKMGALVTASSDISRSYTWVGMKSDETQLLAFPRTGLPSSREDGTYPQPLMAATAEYALHLITEGASAASAAGGGAPIRRVKVGQIETEFAVGVTTGTSSTVDDQGLPLDIRRLLEQYIVAGALGTEGAGGFIQVDAADYPAV